MLEYTIDGNIVFLPSFVLAEQLEQDGQLLEGKALGTAREEDMQLVQHFGDNRWLHSKKEELAAARKKGQTVGKRKLKKVMAGVEPKFLGLIYDLREEKIDEKQFKKQVTAMMKIAWRESFLAGLRAGGAKGTGAGKGGVGELSEVDLKWLKSASKHEMRFLNKFIKQLIEGTTKMPLVKRVGMYMDALTSFYESARVIALPRYTIIHWTGPHDDRTCAGCAYMDENTPFTKMTLPTTPRAGMTPCLTNCRHRLMVRRGNLQEVAEVEKDQKYTRAGHIRNLRKIKREAHG